MFVSVWEYEDDVVTTLLAFDNNDYCHMCVACCKILKKREKRVKGKIKVVHETIWEIYSIHMSRIEIELNLNWAKSELKLN